MYSKTKWNKIFAMFIFLQKVLIIDLNSFTISENKHLQHAVIFMLSWIIVIGLGRAKALLLRSSNSCIIGVPKILKFRGRRKLAQSSFSRPDVARPLPSAETPPLCTFSRPKPPGWKNCRGCLQSKRPVTFWNFSTISCAKLCLCGIIGRQSWKGDFHVWFWCG